MENLNNDHNVYILGAGFPHAAGLPLISNFLDVMRDALPHLDRNGWNAEASAVRDVLGFRLKAASAAYRINTDLDDIEQLFSLASATASQSLLASCKLAIGATLDFAGRKKSTRLRPIRFNSPQASGFSIPEAWNSLDETGGWHKSELYDLLAGVLSGWLCNTTPANNSIITFNYDLILERALQRIGVRFHYGAGTDSLLYSKAFTEKYGSSDLNDLAVLKLHGSVNWWYGDDGKMQIVPEYLSQFSAGRESIRGASTLALLPPTWNKEFHGHFAQVWSQAVAALGTATRIVIIGFSMPTTDNHFKYLLAAGLRENISLRKIIIANPWPAPLKMRIQQILQPSFHESILRSGRLQFIEDKAEDLLAPANGYPNTELGRSLRDGARIGQ